MRWWKQNRTDIDLPAYLIGMERFGLDFFFDVAVVWSFLCVPDGPGVRQIELSDDVVRVLARKFRVEPPEALARIEYMANSGLVDITLQNGVRILGSTEIERRRDEWSRKSGKNTGETPEPLRSHSGAAPDTEVRGRGKRSEPRVDGVRRTSRTNGKPLGFEEQKQKLRSGLIKKINETDESLKGFLDFNEHDGGDRYPEWWGEALEASQFVGFQIDETDPTVTMSFVGALTNVFERHEDAIRAGEMLPGIFATKVIDNLVRDKQLFPPRFVERRDDLREQERRRVVGRQIPKSRTFNEDGIT